MVCMFLDVIHETYQILHAFMCLYVAPMLQTWTGSKVLQTVLSSWARSSKTDSVQLTFLIPLFWVLRSISRWTLQWGRFLWTCGCGPSEHAGDGAWTIRLGILEPKVSSAPWPRNRPEASEASFSAGFRKLFSPTTCTAWFESFLS